MKVNKKNRMLLQMSQTPKVNKSLEMLLHMGKKIETLLLGNYFPHYNRYEKFKIMYHLKLI